MEDRFDFAKMRQDFRDALSEVAGIGHASISKEKLTEIYEDSYSELVEAVKRRSFPHKIACLWVDFSYNYFPQSYGDSSLEKDFLREVILP